MLNSILKKTSLFLYFSIVGVCASAPAMALETPEVQSANAAAIMPAPQSAEDMSWWQRFKSDSEAKAHKIMDEGDLSIMLSGYAHHGRGTYTRERIAELNEDAWGMGFSKQIRDAKDNEESLYALGITDSHYKPQLMAGYAYQWMKPLGSLEAGLGYTTLLISRADYFHHFPFPIVLPVASIGTRSSKIMAAYVPRLSKNKGNGDVLLVFVRFDLK
ncbi:hypothetical protein QN395_16425 [Undibacterium sp. RTI2.2]|uniref:hypothetical protein n=2 Tax=unclassified Undibacterium TaxID=2630295 RepID=UPI002AB37C4F|nr:MULTISPECIES: hypothetical protein [unclassified Undibacterium]MDY7540303.1 hypothetical protein [Undibacterium sp. 5I1]MEB0118081.1 hypothetical protein [Undibacterium sp. RTI2.2]MEB0231280.1 hypothetical protein [Undibacterium sp. 10I3]MEB0259045.1 hypothetical protein [Undibacterium sp. 5I1]